MRQAAHQHTDDEKPFGEYQQVGERHEIFFAVPHLTRKTFAVYQQVDEYDCADDIEYRGAAIQPISTLTRLFS